MNPKGAPAEEAGATEAPAPPEQRTPSQGALPSSDLLGTVAGRLRELEQAANGAASELRRQIVLVEGGRSPHSRSDRVAAAVLHELMLTLSERADGLEYEAELIAGILERARAALKRPATPHPQASLGSRISVGGGVRVPGEARRRPTIALRRPTDAASEPSERSQKPERHANGGHASAGVKLLAAQMALEGHSHDVIKGRLRQEFGIDEPEAAVQEVLGGETGS